MKLAREKAGKPPEEVAFRMGIGLRTYQHYEYGDTMPSLKRLKDFVAIVGGTVFELLEGAIDYGSKVAEFNLQEPLAPKIAEASLPQLFSVPLITRIPASGLTLGFEDIPVEEWVVTSVSAPNAFALRAHGDSMSPKIEDGDTVVCAPDQPFENNKIYAVVAGESEHTLKTVKKVEGGFLLVPFNQAFDTLFVPESKLVKLYKALKVEKLL